ncbi:MAG: M23 family metallopeptidase, partial [Pseudomonadota bacterium]
AGRVAIEGALQRLAVELSDDGVTDYFDPNGESATKFLMKTPINGARLSSRFGKRRHPISGYTRMHKGTDFAAATGTPVYAAGHGTVERASRYGGYGHYVRIRHANGYKTAYAHLSRYGSGIKSGRRVRQGQVIGYVGSTGASTGPHLHYEVIVNGKHVNAMSLRLPTGRKLSGDMLDEFLTTKREIDAVRVAQGAEIEIAAVSAEVQAQ